MENTSGIKWYLDASYVVRKDMMSQTGAIMTLHQGAIQAISSKQNLNTRSSTEAEFISFDDIALKVLWTKLFFEERTRFSNQRKHCVQRQSIKHETGNKW
jgi:hypothetical protein